MRTFVNSATTGESGVGFKVQKQACQTCIYKRSSPLDLKRLEDAARDPHIGFSGYRICHHSDDVCCRGFWNKHKDEFKLGQLAQKLCLVEFVTVDTLQSRRRTK